MRPRILCVCALLAALTACSYLPQELGGPAKVKPKLKGERYDVVVGTEGLSVSPEAEGRPVDIPPPEKNPHWLNRAAMSEQANLEVTGFHHLSSVSLGEEYDQGLAPAPIVTENALIAMDGSGMVSAHARSDIDRTLWENDSGVEEDETSILGGGLTVDSGTVYAATGYGRLMAIDENTGKTKWRVSVGAPVRGAPDALDNVVVVLTADNQTILFDSATGTPIWNHRGIKETSGFFSMTSPVIAQGLVFVAYSSGELFALRLETGRPVWADALASSNRTSAISGFSGIKADPVVQEGVLYAVGASGGMVASAALNGRPLWQADIASITTPWGAGNLMFVVTTRSELIGLFKRDGLVAFKVELIERDNLGRDVTPKLYAPILMNGDVCVINEQGLLRCYDPASGKRTRRLELDEDIASSPVVAGGALYLITRDGVLHHYGR